MLPLTADGASISAPNLLSPQRCVATFSVEGAAGDDEASNDTTRLVIDVIDSGD